MPHRAVLYEKTARIANWLSFVLASSAAPHSTWKAASLRFRLLHHFARVEVIGSYALMMSMRTKDLKLSFCFGHMEVS